MADPFYGEIRTFGFYFAPVRWAQCNGAIMPINQNSTLYSLLGTNYGGDGRTTFGLPELRGRVPMHYGSGPGLNPRQIGERWGAETTTLQTVNLPAHNHDFNLSDGPGDKFNGANNAMAQIAKDTQTGGVNSLLEIYQSNPTYANSAKLRSESISNTGGGQAFNNMQPYLALNFCIALDGLYPSRS